MHAFTPAEHHGNAYVSHTHTRAAAPAGSSRLGNSGPVLPLTDANHLGKTHVPLVAPMV